MNDFQPYLWVVLGIVVAVLLPVVKAFVTREFRTTAAVGLPPWARKYGGLLLFAILTALPLLALYRTQNPTDELMWYTAFLVGFAWESTLEKLSTPAA